MDNGFTLLTPRGHVVFGVVWAMSVIVIVVGFAGVGGLRFAPLLLLLLPFSACRSFLAPVRAQSGSIARRLVGGVGAMTEVAMVAALGYLFVLALLSYCPAPK